MRLCVTLSLLAAVAAQGHDTGFGHSRRALSVVRDGNEYVIDYRIRLQPDEALLQLMQIDQDNDGVVTGPERDRFFARRGQQLAAGLVVETDDGTRLDCRFEACRLGQALTETYRFSMTAAVPVFFLQDTNFPHKHGYTRAYAGDGLRIVSDSDLFHAERIRFRIVRVE